MPDIFATQNPIPADMRVFRCHDPGSLSNDNVLVRDLLAIGLRVVQSSPCLESAFGVAAMLLTQLGRDFEAAAASSIPPEWFTIQNWDQWFNQFGIVDFRGRGGK